MCTSASSRAPAVSSVHVYKLLHLTQASTDNNTICTNKQLLFLESLLDSNKRNCCESDHSQPATTFNTYKLALTSLNQLASTSPCPSNLFSKNTIIMASSLLPLTIQHVIVHNYVHNMHAAIYQK